jgi:epoxyqueuosine reductase
MMKDKEMIHSSKIKDLVFENGADLCGIASVDRFINVPVGFNPTGM